MGIVSSVKEPADVAKLSVNHDLVVLIVTRQSSTLPVLIGYKTACLSYARITLNYAYQLVF